MKRITLFIIASSIAGCSGQAGDAESDPERARFEAVGLGPEFDYCKGEAERQIASGEYIPTPVSIGSQSECLLAIVNSVKSRSDNFEAMCETIGGRTEGNETQPRGCHVLRF